MKKYVIHYDKENKIYWIGFVVRDDKDQPLFVQQIGKDYQRKHNAKKALEKLESEK